MRILLLLLTSVIFCSCSDSQDKQSESKNIDFASFEKILSDTIYPIKASLQRKGLFLNIQVPVQEIYYQNKMNVTCEKIILMSKEKLQNFDTLWINFDVKEAKGEKMIQYYPKERFSFVIDLYTKNKMYRDFNHYIFKNFDGEKLSSFSMYLKVLKKGVDARVSDDYIQVLYGYIDERQGNIQGTFNTEVLKTLKKVIIDGKEWPDFNPADVDYFLNYN